MTYTTEIADWETAGASSNVKNLIWFVAKDGDKVVARAGLRETAKFLKEGEIQFYRIFVDPEYRGEGLWNLLIDARLEYARQKNATAILVLCEDHEFPITSILLNKGFVEIGKQGKGDRLTLVKLDLNASEG